ncbi:MAG: sigma-70 family RNA polymerase sigma factor [Planctomycetota bacterium]
MNTECGSACEHSLAEQFDLHRERLAKIVAFRLDPRLRRRVDVEDVLQEAYLAAQKRVDHYLRERAGSPFVWLRLIVEQTLVDVHRQHLGAQMRDAGREVPLRVRANQDSLSESISHLLAQSNSPSKAAMRAEAAQKIRDVLEQMNEVDREVLALRHFEELTNQEVAEVLGITPKNASIRYVRALKRLKDSMSAPGDAS